MSPLCCRIGSFLVLTLVAAAAAAQRPDVVLADFEGKDYGAWKVEGTAFGPGPAHGAFPHQMSVSGYQGHGLVNSFCGGDRATGRLTSPEFTIDRHYITFLIGGGGYAGKTCMNLVVDGKVLRTATGPNTRPGGSENLAPDAWEVSELAGKPAHLEIVDDATGGWGHINVDQIVLSDRKPPTVHRDVKREIVLAQRYLHLPIRNNAPRRKVTLAVDGQPLVQLDVDVADDAPDWWSTTNVEAWRGKTLSILVDRLPEDSQFLKQITQSDTVKLADDVYHEALRPQFHFSPRRGWTNDPNGMVYYRGAYHLFFQHNPYGWAWGNMHWGHAVSRDLVHWEELDDALWPDPLGPMFSGSAVVDWNNTSGLGRDGQPPQVLVYTAAGSPTVQCLASSTDGRSYAKFAGNPVVRQITGGNRDPKVIWHAPTGRWVMALYVGLPGEPGEVDKKGRPIGPHTIHFLTSPNLKEWTVQSHIEGYHECPDLFALPVDGDAAHSRWVLTAANSDYQVGAFDGTQFTPETPKLKGQLGRGFYAAQTFSDVPASDGRRIQLGWMQAPTPGMPFNQAMSLPLELKLITTPEGPRMTRTPAREVEALRGKAEHVGAIDLARGAANPLAAVHAELPELRAEFAPGTAQVAFTVRGAKIVYDAAAQELIVNEHRAPAPLRDGKQRIAIYVDRSLLEVFASDGLTYVPMPFIPSADDRALEVTASAAVKFTALDVYPLQSAWPRGK